MESQNDMLSFIIEVSPPPPSNNQKCPMFHVLIFIYKIFVNLIKFFVVHIHISPVKRCPCPKTLVLLNPLKRPPGLLKNYSPGVSLLNISLGLQFPQGAMEGLKSTHFIIFQLFPYTNLRTPWITVMTYR